MVHACAPSVVAGYLRVRGRCRCGVWTLARVSGSQSLGCLTTTTSKPMICPTTPHTLRYTHIIIISLSLGAKWPHCLGHVLLRRCPGHPQEGQQLRVRSHSKRSQIFEGKCRAYLNVHSIFLFTHNIKCNVSNFLGMLSKVFRPIKSKTSLKSLKNCI